MENLKELKKAIDESTVMALATAVGDVPNVRIVNYVWEEKEPNKIYFTSSSENDKVKEIAGNGKVAICTIPTDIDSVVTLRSNNAVATKSSKTIKDVQALFLEKMPSYGEALEYIGDTLDVFEIDMKEALITLGFENAVSIKF